MNYYETKYGSPEAAAVKAAGAKWDPHMKVWESPIEIPGVTPAQPDRQVVVKNNDDFHPLCQATMKLIAALAKGLVNDEELAGFRQKLADAGYEGQCCLAAIELYLAVRAAGVSTRGFWTRPTAEIEAEIEAAI